MINPVKLQQLDSNYRASESEISFKEYVEQESINDPNFFAWLFDEAFEEDFDKSLSDDQKVEFAEFMSNL